MHTNMNIISSVVSYQLRDNLTVYQPKFKGITYGKHMEVTFGMPCLGKIT